jgi:hypothetical protein
MVMVCAGIAPPYNRLHTPLPGFKEDIMTTQIVALAARLNEAGFKACIWKASRIYLNGYGRDMKCCIMFDDPDADAATLTGPMGLFDGAALKVYSNADQSHAWLVNRAKQVKHVIMLQLEEAGVITGPVCETWQEVIL